MCNREKWWFLQTTDGWTNDEKFYDTFLRLHCCNLSYFFLSHFYSMQQFSLCLISLFSNSVTCDWVLMNLSLNVITVTGSSILKFNYQLNIINILLIWGNLCIVKDIHYESVVEHPPYRTVLIISLILLVLCTTYIRLVWGDNNYND